MSSIGCEKRLSFPNLAGIRIRSAVAKIPAAFEESETKGGSSK